MTPIALALFVALGLIGTPLYVIFGAAAMLLFSTEPGGSITSVGIDVFSEKFSESPTLVTIPLFTFAGYIMARAGTPTRLVELSKAWFGWLRGGLAIVCLVASAFFTTFTGGSGITIVAIGGLLYPALIAQRYPERFSLGLVTAGGSIGLLFPPSVPIILYGVVANVLIDRLFLAAIVPGIISVIALSAYAAWIGWSRPETYEPFKLRRALRALWRAKWEAILPVGLLVGLYGGWLRIHEAAAFTALYTLVVEVFVYRDVSFTRDLPRIIRESMTLVGAILLILATAIGFTSYLIQAGIPQKLLGLMDGFIESRFTMLLALNAVLFIVGMLMDVFSAVVVVVPLIVPIAQQFGVDPYHLAVIFLLNLEIGYLTPPVGLNLFISSFRFQKSVPELYRAVLPSIALLIGVLLLVTYVPALSTWLPELVAQDQPGTIDLDTPLGTSAPQEPDGGEAPNTDRNDPQKPADESGAGENGAFDLDALERELDEHR